jgi:hypothetical protein
MSFEHSSHSLKEFNSIMGRECSKVQDIQECLPCVTISPLDGCDYSSFPLLQSKIQGTYKFQQSSPETTPCLMFYDKNASVGCPVWSSFINDVRPLCYCILP